MILGIALGAGLLSLSLSTTASGTDRSSIQPQEEALRAAENLEASKISVDSLGNLWAWSRKTGALTTITPDGAISADSITPGASAVSFDSEYGAAWLEDSGNSLFIRAAANPEKLLGFPLHESYGDIAWLSPGRIALSTTRSATRVEIFELSPGEIVARWGEVKPVVPRLGTVRLNFFWLHYDHTRKSLYSLESFTGELLVFDHTGAVTTAGTITNKNSDTLQDWLQKTDAQNRQEGEMEEVTLHQWSGLSVDQQGAAWVHQSCERKGSSQSLLGSKITPEGELTSTSIDLGPSGCCSLTSAAWENWWVIYRDPESPRNGCAQTRRMRNEAHENARNHLNALIGPRAGELLQPQPDGAISAGSKSWGR